MILNNPKLKVKISFIIYKIKVKEIHLNIIK